MESNKVASAARNIFYFVFTIALTIAALLPFTIKAYSQTAEAGTAEYYISADATPGGDGSQDRPFSTLMQAEAVANPGDTLYLLPSATGKLIDGGIILKPGQKLLGIDANGQLLENENDRVQLTNSSDLLQGKIIGLADHNEIAGIAFRNLAGYAIFSLQKDYSGTYIHHTSYSGNSDNHIEDERGLVYAISFNVQSGQRNGIKIEHSNFYDGEDLGGIRVFHAGSSQGNYQFQDNHFSDLGGRAYFVQTRDNSRVETVILDSSADNIGRGARNSDSIIPYLMGRSEQTMLVRNFHYNNTKQLGSLSNTGIEAYIFGHPRPDEANWCNGCRLTFTILDSVIENAVTDPIQFSNAGTNSELRFEIRNTRIAGGNPRQGGGGISLNMQTVPRSGSHTSLLIENSDIIGTTGFGFALNNRGGGEDGFTTLIDLGGGALGSRGNNRFINNTRGDLKIPLKSLRLPAKNNWWEETLTIFDSNNQPITQTQVDFTPSLIADPR